MRVDLKKFVFIGLSSEKKDFFQKAQKKGVVHFIDLSQENIKEVPEEINKITAAIKILRGFPTASQEHLSEYDLAIGIAQKIIDLKEQRSELAEDERVLSMEIARIAVFGDFSLDDINYIQSQGKRVVQFFVSKMGLFDHSQLPGEVLYVGTEHALDYFISINRDSVQYDKMTEIKIDQPLGELRHQIQEVRKNLHETEHRLKNYTKYNTFLHHAFIKNLNNFQLESNQDFVQLALDEDLFAVEGWVPVNKIEELYQLADQTDVHIEEVEIEEMDRIPTYLENKGLRRIGEDLVHIYDTPSASDKDPSLWILFFFSFFFALIISDAGYGLIFLGTALFIRYKYGELKGASKRFWTLLLVLSFACIAWGTLTSSFFGIKLSDDNPLRKISVIHWLAEKKAAYHFDRKDDVYEEWVKKIPKLSEATSSEVFLSHAIIQKNGKSENEMVHKFGDQILFELALLIGIIHLSFSFIRYLDRNWAGIGWILFMIGGYLYFPYFLKTTSMVHFVLGINPETAGKIGLYLIAIGYGLAIILSVIKHKLLGIIEMMTVIQIFADSMSYLRIYALALAGAMVTETINDFAAMVPLVFGILLLIIGHITNMALGIMGGVIHGLRLNFLEWYHYSFEGGGKKFNPLRLEKIEYKD